VLILRVGEQSLTEVVSDNQTDLPSEQLLINHRCKGNRSLSAALGTDQRYDVCVQIERLKLDVFLRLNEELEQDCRQADIFSRLPAINRFLPGPLSLIRTEVSRESILVYTFHTFPDHCAIVKTQTLVERKTDNKS
jgi:hypothetical protein